LCKMRSGLEPDPTYCVLMHNKIRFIVGNGSKPFRIFHFATAPEILKADVPCAEQIAEQIEEL